MRQLLLIGTRDNNAVEFYDMPVLVCTKVITKVNVTRPFCTRDKSLETFLMPTIGFIATVWRFMLPGKAMPCFFVFECIQGAVQLTQNPVTNSNSKHFDVRHRF